MLQYQVILTTAFMQNSRLIWDDVSRCAVICDPGAAVPAFAALLKEKGLTLKSILLTHGHLDHVGGTAALADEFQVPVIGPGIEDAPLLAALDQQAAAFGLPRCPSFAPQYVSDGDMLELLPGVKFKALATPGHTPGGRCYLQEESKIVVVGDTLFAGSVGRTDFPGGSFEALERSISTKLYPLPDDTVVLCGHGPDTSIGEEKRYNPYVQAD